MQYQTVHIISNRKIADAIYLLRVEYSAEKPQPGQFFMLKAEHSQLTLMRPISVYRSSENSISFMYRVAGKGTTEFSRLKSRNKMEILGPLGTGFPCEKVSGKIALVGGGIGIPPLYETAKKLKEMGQQVDLYLGYKDKLFGYEEFADVADNIFISSEVGKEGYKGYITDLLHPTEYDAVFTCGPEVMMFKIKHLCQESHTPLWMSLERRMACGIGACLGCSCKTRNGMQQACKEGPVFFADDILE